MKKGNIKISKFLSYVLRHKPESIDLKLDRNGYALVDELIKCAAENDKKFSREQLREVVATDDKQRFSFSEDGHRIRANQGHSIKVDLALEAIEPPEKLYHGTATRFLESIFQHGLQARSRQHIHLSQDMETAIKVGQRHGKPVVLEIEAQRMNEDGYQFYCSENGIWLTDKVPPQYFLAIDQEKSQ